MNPERARGRKAHALARSHPPRAELTTLRPPRLLLDRGPAPWTTPAGVLFLPDGMTGASVGGFGCDAVVDEAASFGRVGRSCPPCRPPRLLFDRGPAPWTKRGQLRRAMFPIGRHRHRWLIHASSTATVPSASRVAVVEGWISRTGVLIERTMLRVPGVVRSRTTRQLDGAMFYSGGTRRRRLMRGCRNSRT